MKASIVNLHKQIHEILRALDRNETVEITYRGKVKGEIVPKYSDKAKRSVREHPFCGMSKSKDSVNTLIRRLRDVRHHKIK